MQEEVEEKEGCKKKARIVVHRNPLAAGNAEERDPHRSPSATGWQEEIQHKAREERGDERDQAPDIPSALRRILFISFRYGLADSSFLRDG